MSEMEFVAVGAVVALALAVIIFAAAKISESRNPPVGQFLTVSGLRLHYLVRGAGEPIVLIHGNVTMIEDYITSGLIERLAKRHQVFAFDRPGFGYSERPRGRSWPADRQAMVFEAALQELGISHATVVGHSWGTLVAVALALRAPERVKALVLLSGFYFPKFRIDALLAAPPSWPIIGDILRYTVSPILGAVLMPLQLRVMFGPPKIPQRFKQGFPISMTLRPWQIRATSEDGASMNRSAAYLVPNYADLRMPVLIMAGSEDRVVTPSRQSARLRDVVTGSEFVVVEGAGHMVHHTDLDVVSGAIERVASGAPITH